MRDCSPYSLGRKGEAAMLSRRTGLQAKACEDWMRYAGLASILELKDRYPNTNHAECMRRAACEIENFVLDGPMTEDERAVWGD